MKIPSHKAINKKTTYQFYYMFAILPSGPRMTPNYSQI